ncbi:putative holin [unidentified bacterial endosymbiont]|uniref:putative holin n=1 Tax=unidentified bacterial endosymbiont TaxID=2355 RepID=UPI0020A0CFC6|nr:putative holin [unidentified bacterial endosymbiont]
MITAICEFDFSVITASFSGALCFIINARCFNKKQKRVAFFISFSMGFIGADVSLDIINSLVPAINTEERALGAFVCSALIITVFIRIKSLVDGTFTKK